MVKGTFFFFFFFLGSFKSPSLCVALFHRRLNIMWISLMYMYTNFYFYFLWFPFAF